jgi:hypothetical protein
MLTYDTPALLQTGSRNLTGQKTLPTKAVSDVENIILSAANMSLSKPKQKKKKKNYKKWFYNDLDKLRGSKNASHDMGYLPVYEACDQISDFCHQ